MFLKVLEKEIFKVGRYVYVSTVKENLIIEKKVFLTFCIMV